MRRATRRHFLRLDDLPRDEDDEDFARDDDREPDEDFFPEEDFPREVERPFDDDDEERRLLPEPPFLPPPSCLLTVAQARRSASFVETPRFSYPSSMCSALRFCLAVYLDLSPRGMGCSSTKRGPSRRASQN